MASVQIDIPDTTLAAAILDRLAMHAIRIDINGPSYRQHVATDRAKGRGTTLPVSFRVSKDRLRRYDAIMREGG